MKSTSVHALRAAAARWLIDEAGCSLVTIEQGLDGDNRRPDLLGCTPEGKIIEIEIKRSVADYKTNLRKYGCGDRVTSLHAPWRFFFLVPPEILNELPPPTDGAGLLALGSCVNAAGVRSVSEVVTATDNPSAVLLTESEQLHFAIRATTRFSGLLAQVAKLESRHV